jgi:hypothetical protein
MAGVLFSSVFGVKTGKPMTKFKPGDRVSFGLGETGTILRSGCGVSNNVIVVAPDKPTSSAFNKPSYEDKAAAKTLGIDIEDKLLRYAYEDDKTKPIIDAKTPPGTKITVKFKGEDVEGVVLRYDSSGKLLCRMSKTTGTGKSVGMTHNREAALRFGFDPDSGHFGFLEPSELTFAGHYEPPTKPEVAQPKGTLMTRKELAEKVVKALSPYGYAYGGYVRDLVAGDDFNDIDFYLSKHGNYDSKFGYAANARATSLLIGLGLKVKTTTDAKHVNGYHPSWIGNSTRLFKTELTISDPNSDASIDLELVWSDSTDKSKDTPYPSLDADINALYLDKEGKPKAIEGQNTEAIIAHIKERKFVVPDKSVMQGERLNKLLKKGYSLTVGSTGKIEAAPVEPKITLIVEGSAGPQGVPATAEDKDVEIQRWIKPIDCRPGDVVNVHGQPATIITGDGSHSSWTGYVLTRRRPGDGWNGTTSSMTSPEDQAATPKLGFDPEARDYYYVWGTDKLRLISRAETKPEPVVETKPEFPEVKVGEPVKEPEPAKSDLSSITPFLMGLGAAVGGLLNAALNPPTKPVRVSEEIELTDEDIIEIEEIEHAA